MNSPSSLWLWYFCYLRDNKGLFSIKSQIHTLQMSLQTALFSSSSSSVPVFRSTEAQESGVMSWLAEAYFLITMELEGSSGLFVYPV